MLSYCLVILLWCTWSLATVAWLFSIALARVFRNVACASAASVPAAAPAPASPIPPSIEANPASTSTAAPATQVLDYARRRPPKPPLLRRRPWLLAAAALLCCVILLLPLVPAVVIWSLTGIQCQFAIASFVAGAAMLAAAFCLMRRGLKRQPDGVPAAAHWPRRWLKRRVLWGLPAIVLLVLALDQCTKYRLRRMEDQLDAQTRSFGIRLPIRMRNAADDYLLMSVPDSIDVAEWGYGLRLRDGPRAAPPVLSPAQEAAVPLLLEASRQPVADWLAYWRDTSWHRTPDLPDLRRAAQLFRVHAAREAQAGRIDPALADIRAVRVMARHAAQVQLEGMPLVASEIDQEAALATQEVLPFLRDPRQLDQLACQDPSWHRTLRHDLVYGLRIARLQEMCRAYGGGFDADEWRGFRAEGLLGYGGGTAKQGVNLLRAFYADADIAAMREFCDQLDATASQEFVRAYAQIQQLQTVWMHRASGLGFWTAENVRALCDATLDCAFSEVLSDLQRVGLAARRYHFRTGHFPASLDELVTAGLLDRVPTDPYSGKPVLMKDRGDELIIHAVGFKDYEENIVGVDALTFRVCLRPLWEPGSPPYQSGQLRLDDTNSLLPSLSSPDADTSPQK